MLYHPIVTADGAHCSDNRQTFLYGKQDLLMRRCRAERAIAPAPLNRSVLLAHLIARQHRVKVQCRTRFSHDPWCQRWNAIHEGAIGENEIRFRRFETIL